MCVYASARKADDNWISRVRTGWFRIRRTARNYKTPRECLGQGGAMIAWEYNPPQSVQPWDVVAGNMPPRYRRRGSGKRYRALIAIHNVAWTNREKHKWANYERERCSMTRICGKRSLYSGGLTTVELKGKTNYKTLTNNALFSFPERTEVSCSQSFA